jgi:hypothetical protein
VILAAKMKFYTTSTAQEKRKPVDGNKAITSQEIAIDYNTNFIYYNPAQH